LSEPIIQVENLRKNYGAVQALRGMSFAVEQGVLHLRQPKRLNIFEG
jgi:ABC-type sugar transport system ATPase subunit